MTLLGAHRISNSHSLPSGLGSGHATPTRRVGFGGHRPQWPAKTSAAALINQRVVSESPGRVSVAGSARRIRPIDVALRDLDASTTTRLLNAGQANRVGSASGSRWASKLDLQTGSIPRAQIQDMADRPASIGAAWFADSDMHSPLRDQHNSATPEGNKSSPTSPTNRRIGRRHTMILDSQRRTAIADIWSKPHSQEFTLPTVTRSVPASRRVSHCKEMILKDFLEGFSPSSASIQKSKSFMELSPLEKKQNAQNALARDRASTRDHIAANSEEPHVRAWREGQVDSRQWEYLLAPIEKPKDHVPEPFLSQGLPTGLPPIPPVKLPKISILTEPEAETIIRVCGAFSALVRPHVPPGEDPGVTLFTRPSLCRLILALRIESANGYPVFHRIVRLFDGYAEPLVLKGCPMTSGTVNGLVLSAQRNNRPVPAHELPIAKFFAAMLIELAEELRGSRSSDEQLAVLKEQLFTSKLPSAESQARHRLRVLRKVMSRGRDAVTVPYVSTDEGGEPKEANSRKVQSPSNAKQGHCDLSLGRAEAPSGTPSRIQRNLSELKEQSMKGSDTNVDSDPQSCRSSVSSNDDASTTASEGITEPLETMCIEDALVAHTFTVSKGELLTSMLLEPELLVIVLMFDKMFSCLFEAYSDTSTTFLGHSEWSGGHMSYAAFMQCCIDFGLFPKIVDFCTLQKIYCCAESALPVDVEEIHKVMQRRRSMCPFYEGDVVELGPGVNDATGGLQHGHGQCGKILDVDVNGEPMAARLLLPSGKKRWYRCCELVKSSQTFVLELETEREKELPVGVSWIHCDLSDMSELELRTLSILAAVDEWILERRVRCRDVFGMVDKDGTGDIGPKEIFMGIQLMSLDSPPTYEEVEAMMPLLDADHSGEVNMKELDMALLAVRERKGRHRKSENLFLKGREEMTPVELAAEQFFVPLESVLQASRMTAREFLMNFDADGNGSLSFDELLTVGGRFGITIPNVDMFKRALMLVDPNIDGNISISELERVLHLVREASRVKQLEPNEMKNPFLFCMPGQGTMEYGPNARIFGKKAFSECLLKIALGYLSFHASTDQANLPSYSKALWLVCYLGWQFKCRKLEVKVTKEISRQIDRWKKVMGRTFKFQRGLSDVVSKLNEQGLEARPDSPKEEEGSRLQYMAGRRRSAVCDPEVPAAPQGIPQGWRRHSVGALPSANDKTDGIDKLKDSVSTTDGIDKLKDFVHTRSFANHLPPLRRLIIQRPNLFKEVPVRPPDLGGDSGEFADPCEECGQEPYRGWGSFHCPRCSQADQILKMFMLDDDEGWIW